MRRIGDTEAALVLSIAGPSGEAVAEFVHMNLARIKDRFGDQFGVAARLGEHLTGGPSVQITVTRERRKDGTAGCKKGVHSG